MAAQKSDDAIQNLGRGLLAAFRKPYRLLVLGVELAVCYYVLTNLRTLGERLGLGDGLNYVVLLFVVFIPMFTLIAYSNDTDGGADSEGKFSEIGFKNKEGTVPKQVSKYRDFQDKRKIVLEYKSPGIPLENWIARKRELETALNLTITNIREDPQDKRIIIIDTIPNKYHLPVSTRQNPFWWDESYMPKDEGKAVIGMHILDPIVVDLNKFPHMLMAGTTGSGKSVIVQCVLWQFVKKGARPIIIDFKGGIEFGGDWEKFGTVVTELDDAVDIVQKLAMEQEARFRHFRDDGIKYNYDCKNIEAYNKKHPDDPMQRIIFVVDEAGDLLSKDGADKEKKEKISVLEGSIASLAMKARAVGINIIFGIQRPDAKVLTGQIRNNIPIKVCGRCMGGDGVYLSQMVLGDAIATTLDSTIEGRFYGNFGQGIIQFQSYYFEPKKFLKEGNWRKGKVLVLDNEVPISDPERHVPLEEDTDDENLEFERDTSLIPDWVGDFGKVKNGRNE